MGFEPDVVPNAAVKVLRANLRDAEARIEELEGALRAIADGHWASLLASRYAKRRTEPARAFSVPEDATIRVLARAALKKDQAK